MALLSFFAFGEIRLSTPSTEAPGKAPTLMFAGMPSYASLAHNPGTYPLSTPIRVVREILGKLETAGILSRRGETAAEEAFQLGQPSTRIRVIDVLAALRGPREPVAGDPDAVIVERLLGDLDAAVADTRGAQTLAELLSQLPSLDPPAARG